VLNNTDEISKINIEYPAIVKPRDNSGSRGVIYCQDLKTLENAVQEAFQYTNKGNLLIEEFIEGKEYSVEGIHYNRESHVLQITEKIITDFPYNVELGHIQPANLSSNKQDKIKWLISNIAQALEFENCASHTELKINDKGIKIIETSPRLGGDFISSTLVPLSTGTNMEDMLIDIATRSGFSTEALKAPFNKCSGITYFELPEGIVTSISGLDKLSDIDGVHDWKFDLEVGDKVNKITSSLNRYGYVILQSNDNCQLKNILSGSRENYINSIIIK
jgi:biotin carboxylase